MRALRDELERNYVMVQAGQAELRAASIQSMVNRPTRMGETALLAFATHAPELTEAILDVDLPDGWRYIGAGSQHSVVLHDQTIHKVNRQSTSWGEPQRQRYRETADEMHRTLKKYLGSYAVDQEVEVGEHPFRPYKRAVVLTQDHLEFEDTGLFHGYDDTLHTDKIAVLEAQYPGVTEDLVDFAHRSLKLYGRTKLLVDTSGLQNIVIARRDYTRTLTCLDGLPIANAKPIDRRRILTQLHALHALAA